MSPPIAGATSVPSSTRPCTISISSACGMVAGLMQTRPATSANSKPDHRVRAPPMLSPTTTICSTRCASRPCAARTSAAQSVQRVVSMSSIVVPWPGRRGISTWYPRAAIASAMPRIDDGFPVKPWMTSTPVSLEPSLDIGSASGRTAGEVMAAKLAVRVVGSVRLVPPVVGDRSGPPVGIGVDAVDRAHRQALVAAAAQLRKDDHIGAVVEDRTEVRWAVAQARVAVDALVHLDTKRHVLPLLVAGAGGDALVAGGGHSRATVVVHRRHRSTGRS